MFSRIDFDVPMWDSSNLDVRETHVQVFLCPSDTYSADWYVIRDDSSHADRAIRRLKLRSELGTFRCDGQLGRHTAAESWCLLPQQPNSRRGGFGRTFQHFGDRRADERADATNCPFTWWPQCFRERLDRGGAKSRTSRTTTDTWCSSRPNFAPISSTGTTKACLVRMRAFANLPYATDPSEQSRNSWMQIFTMPSPHVMGMR